MWSSSTSVLKLGGLAVFHNYVFYFSSPPKNIITGVHSGWGGLAVFHGKDSRRLGVLTKLVRVVLTNLVLRCCVN